MVQVQHCFGATHTQSKQKHFSFCVKEPLLTKWTNLLAHGLLIKSNGDLTSSSGLNFHEILGFEISKRIVISERYRDFSIDMLCKTFALHLDGTQVLFVDVNADWL